MTTQSTASPSKRRRMLELRVREITNVPLPPEKKLPRKLTAKEMESGLLISLDPLEKFPKMPDYHSRDRVIKWEGTANTAIGQIAQMKQVPHEYRVRILTAVIKNAYLEMTSMED